MVASVQKNDLAKLVRLQDFSFADFECALRSEGVDTHQLSDVLQKGLDFLCECYRGSIRQAFCDKLIGWAEQNIALIPLSERTESGDAGIVVAIQKYAIRQLFLPDTGNGLSLDRWQLLKDCFQLHVKKPEAVNLKAMSFEIEENDYTFGREFRFCGNTTIMEWLESTTLCSLYEFKNGDLVNEMVYENVEELGGCSFTPDVVGERIFGPDGEVINEQIYIYTLSSSFELKLAEEAEEDWIYHHSYMNGGLPVVCAGEVAIDKGKIVGINHRSGHYRPSGKSLDVCVEILSARKLMAEDCCYMFLDEEVKHLFFNSDFMAKIRGEEDLKIMVAPVMTRGISYKAGTSVLSG